VAVASKSEIESGAAKPQPCKVRLVGIPQELKDRPQWVCWAYERRKQRWTKVPYQPGKGPAAADNPATWSPFDKVAGYVMATGEIRGKTFSGIGYEFAETDPFCARRKRGQRTFNLD
jgi:primase-polymerase (primpol)-like protein